MAVKDEETIRIPSDSATEAFETALDLHEKKRLAEAEALYRKVLAASPDHAAALCYLGLLLLEQNKLEESLLLLQQAIKHDPQSSEAHNFLGTALQCLGKHGDALACHDKALALQPGYGEARYQRGRALQILGRVAEAIGCYEFCIAEAPNNAQYQLAMAGALQAAGRDEEAFVRFRNAANLDPGLANQLSKALADYSRTHQVVAQKGMQRLNHYIGQFVANQGNARMGSYPGLNTTPFHDAEKFPGALELERAYQTIRGEIQNLAASEFQEEGEGLKGDGKWDVFLFYERGRKNENNCNRCPTIARIIENTNTVKTQAGLLYVSKLNPGTRIKPHRGPTNLRLRCHLGIHIPDGDCGLKVGGEFRRWQEGQCIVFDDSLEHEAWNSTAVPRIVLIIDFWHPDLTPMEIAYLEGLHRFASFQANSLNRYWSANSQAKSRSRTHYD